MVTHISKTPDNVVVAKGQVAGLMFIAVFLSICLVCGCSRARYIWIEMSTSSMEPTIQAGQKVLVDTDILRYAPKRFDVVVLQLKQEGYPDQLIVKRIVGLRGEEISIKAGVNKNRRQARNEFAGVCGLHGETSLLRRSFAGGPPAPDRVRGTPEAGQVRRR